MWAWFEIEINTYNILLITIKIKTAWAGRMNLRVVPTTKVTSAINWLLNIAAFRSLTVGLDACQFGSTVVICPDMLVDRVLNAFAPEPLPPLLAGLGDASGEVGALAGWVTTMWDSLWDMELGGDTDSPALFMVSTKKFNKLKISRRC